MPFRLDYAVIVTGVVTLTITPIAAAEEIGQTVHIEANIAGSCYSADAGFGSFWMMSGEQLDRISQSGETAALGGCL